MSNEETCPYLSPTGIIVSDHPAVIEYSEKVLKGVGDTSLEKPLRFTTAFGMTSTIRIAFHREEAYRASVVPVLKEGYCVSKASYYAPYAASTAFRRIGLPPLKTILPPSS